MFEAVAAAGRAAAVAGIETEGAGRVLALARLRQPRKQIADGVERADVARRIRARGAADAALIHHDHVVDQLRALRARGALPGFSVGLPLARSSAGNSTSCTSVDLPEPLTPVTQTRRPSGIATSMFLRLCSAAPSRRSDAGGAARRRGVRAADLPRACGETDSRPSAILWRRAVTQWSVEHDLAAVLARARARYRERDPRPGSPWDRARRRPAYCPRRAGGA